MKRFSMRNLMMKEAMSLPGKRSAFRFSRQQFRSRTHLKESRSKCLRFASFQDEEAPHFVRSPSPDSRHDYFVFIHLREHWIISFAQQFVQHEFRPVWPPLLSYRSHSLVSIHLIPKIERNGGMHWQKSSMECRCLLADLAIPDLGSSPPRIVEMCPSDNMAWAHHHHPHVLTKKMVRALSSLRCILVIESI